MLGLSQLLLSPCYICFLDPFVKEPLLSESLLRDPSATNLTRTLTLRGDRPAIHPADELNFDIREQHKDSDTQRRDSNVCQCLK